MTLDPDALSAVAEATPALSAVQLGIRRLMGMRMGIWEAQSDRQIKACYRVMRQLRPQYSVDSFLARVRFQQELGYRLVCLESNGAPVAVAGYQIRETLIDGRFLHVDDLVTDDAHRSRGHGAELLLWLVDRAHEFGCESLQLDSAFHREDAHRFYEREGLDRIAYHFSQRTRDPRAASEAPSAV